MADLSTELGLAVDAAAAGSRIALERSRQPRRIERKPDGTMVTDADWAVEAQIRLRLARAFPSHNILGEEEGLSAAGGGPPVPGAPTWVVDPIDGTNNYIAGIPIWGTLVSLEIGGRFVLGVCDAPALGETYTGARGLGAHLNGTAIEVDAASTLADATVVFAGAEEWLEGPGATFFSRLCGAARRTRGFGDFWGHMLVARGAAHVMVERGLSVWDVAAVIPIVTEAGGKVTGLDGEPWQPGKPSITATRSLHDEVVALAASA